MQNQKIIRKLRLVIVSVSIAIRFLTRDQPGPLLLNWEIGTLRRLPHPDPVPTKFQQVKKNQIVIRDLHRADTKIIFNPYNFSDVQIPTLDLISRT